MVGALSAHPLLLPRSTEAAWHSGLRGDEAADIAAWEAAIEAQVRCAQVPVPVRTRFTPPPMSQLLGIRTFNSDLPVMGREGRASQITPVDDDPAIDAEGDEEEDEDADEVHRRSSRWRAYRRPVPFLLRRASDPAEVWSRMWLRLCAALEYSY